MWKTCVLDKWKRDINPSDRDSEKEILIRVIETVRKRYKSEWQRQWERDINKSDGDSEKVRTERKVMWSTDGHKRCVGY